MKTYISPAARVLGWLGLGAAALLLADVAWRGTGSRSAVPALTLFILMGLIVIFALRPRVVTSEQGIRVVNPMREVFVPWSAFTGADVTDVLRVHAGERVFRAWAVRENKRRRVRDNLRRVEGNAGAPEEALSEEERPANRAARHLLEEARAHQGRAGAAHEPVVTWSPAAVAAVAVPAAMLLVVVLFF